MEGHSFFWQKEITPCRLVDSYLLVLSFISYLAVRRRFWININSGQVVRFFYTRVAMDTWQIQ